MNKYAALGLAMAASSGRQVMVLSHSQHAARQATLDFDVDELQPSRVLRANGRERIEWASGGSIRFMSHRSNLRGLIADVVFIDWDVDIDSAIAIDLYEHARNVVRGRPDGEVIRA